MLKNAMATLTGGLSALTSVGLSPAVSHPFKAKSIMASGRMRILH